MDDAAGGCLGAILGLAVVGFVIYIVIIAVLYVLAGAYCILIAAIMALIALLDSMMSAGFFAQLPAVMWAVWGAIVGGALAFWTIAPLYGLRKLRPLIAGAPFALMGVVALLAHTVAG